MADSVEACFKRLNESEYSYSGVSLKTRALPEMKSDFAKNGFVLIRNHFSPSEIGKLAAAIEGCAPLMGAAFDLADNDALKYSQSHWTQSGDDDILARTVGCVKLIDVNEQLLDRGELYMYHGKVLMKQPKTGGALIWHQDYGYWYNNRALFPDFITTVIALTKSDRENGGVELLKGSHLCGRIEHTRQAGQTGADPERVALLDTVLERVPADLAPGDTVTFHGNTLHRSGNNDSHLKRWNLIFSFNAKHNSPDLPHYNAQYAPVKRFDADAIEKCAHMKIEHRDYLDPSANPNISATRH